MKNTFCVLFVFLGFVELAYSQGEKIGDNEIDVFEYVNENGKSVFLYPMNDSLILENRNLGAKATLYLDVEAMEVEGTSVYVGNLNWKGLKCEMFVQFLDDVECMIESGCEELSLGICHDKNAAVEIVEKNNPFMSETSTENDEELTTNSSFYDGEEFVEFSLLEAKEKHLFLTERNWKNLGTNSYVEDGKAFEIWNYFSEDGGVKFFLTLKFVVGNENRLDETKLSISVETLYNSWVKELKNLGYSFEKMPNEGDVYASTDGESYVVYLEKRKVKDMNVFEISVVNVIY
jgi:hypothetical protein